MLKSKLVVAILVISMAFLIALGTIIILTRSNSSQGTTFKQTSNNAVNNDINVGANVSLQFDAGNVSEMTVAAGSVGHGTISVNITEADSLLIFDYMGGGFNQSATDLPAGLSVSLNMYGNVYDVPSIDQVARDNFTYLPLSSVPLLPTTLGETTIHYTISAASSVPGGPYSIHILFWPILQGDEVPASTRAAGINEMYGLGEEYTVTLNVQ